MNTPSDNLMNLQINMLKNAFQMALLPIKTAEQLTHMHLDLIRHVGEHGRRQDVCSDGADLKDHYGNRAHDIDVERDL